MPDWLKWVIGGIVIIGLGIAVLATGGAAAGVAGFILAGAFKGALIGAVSGALISGTIGGISTAIAGEGFWSGFAGGAADGFMFGAITGAISGAVTNGIRVAQAAKMWDKGTFKSSWRSMSNHYHRKVVKAGLSKGNNVIKYTNDAVGFMNRNWRVLSMHRGGAGLQHVWTLDPYYFGQGMNGLFTSVGKIISFSYYYIS